MLKLSISCVVRPVRWLPQSLLIILLTLAVPRALAQDEPAEGQSQEESATEQKEETQQQEPRSVKTFFPNFFDDQKQIWSFPARADSWKEPGLWVGIGVSAASFSLDGSPAERLRTDTSFKDFNEIFDSTGASVALAVLPLAITGLGELAGNDDWTEIGWKTSEAAADAYLVANVWKLGSQRSRPHEGKEYGFWEGGNSFPSGHAAVAWAIAATTAHHFKDRKWVAWLVYPAAAIVSFSRTSSGNHFPSDAVVGSALGFAIGRYAVK